MSEVEGEPRQMSKSHTLLSILTHIAFMINGSDGLVHNLG